MLQHPLLTPPRQHKQHSDTRSDISTDHDDLDQPSDAGQLSPTS
jgi:hypothetical protein